MKIQFFCLIIPSCFLVTMGAFHYAKDSGNFGQNSNGKIPLSFFRLEYLESPLEVVHLFRFKCSDQNWTFHLINRFFGLIGEFGKGIKSDKSHSYWLDRFYQKMSFHFPQVFLLISEQSVWHNGKHPVLMGFHCKVYVRNDSSHVLSRNKALICTLDHLLLM